MEASVKQASSTVLFLMMALCKGGHPGQAVGCNAGGAPSAHMSRSRSREKTPTGLSHCPLKNCAVRLSSVITEGQGRLRSPFCSDGGEVHKRTQPVPGPVCSCGMGWEQGPTGLSDLPLLFCVADRSDGGAQEEENTWWGWDRTV